MNFERERYGPQLVEFSEERKFSKKVENFIYKLLRWHFYQKTQPKCTAKDFENLIFQFGDIIHIEGEEYFIAYINGMLDTEMINFSNTG
jgi:hypothetical protein